MQAGGPEAEAVPDKAGQKRRGILLEVDCNRKSRRSSKEVRCVWCGVDFGVAWFPRLSAGSCVVGCQGSPMLALSCVGGSNPLFTFTECQGCCCESGRCEES